MRQRSIIRCEPSANTLIDAAYVDPDYRDAYIVDGVDVDDVASFATRFFLAQPAWLARVSMSLATSEQRLDAIGPARYEHGSAIGSWEIHGRTDDEMIFGEYMGFMEYRFSFLRRPDGRIEASTSVRYLKRFGHIYFGVVKPFHIGFLKRALRNAASSPSSMVPAA